MKQGDRVVVSSSAPYYVGETGWIVGFQCSILDGKYYIDIETFRGKVISVQKQFVIEKVL